MRKPRLPAVRRGNDPYEKMVKYLADKDDQARTTTSSGTGPQGPQGATGATGPQGPQGSSGGGGGDPLLNSVFSGDFSP